MRNYKWTTLMRNYKLEMRMIKDKFPLSIGEEMVRNERTLLSKVEDGKMMMSADSVRFLVLHCSATRRNQDYSVEQLRRDHKSRGFYDTCLALHRRNVLVWMLMTFSGG